MKTTYILRSAAAALATFSLLAVAPLAAAADTAKPRLIKVSELPVEIKAGMSQAEVEKLLGEPNNKPRWINGTTTWTYSTNVWNQRFDVDFDATGKVRSAGLFKTAELGNT